MVFEEDPGTGALESYGGASPAWEGTQDSTIYPVEIEDAPRVGPTVEPAVDSAVIEDAPRVGPTVGYAVDSSVDSIHRPADLLLVDDNFGKLQCLAGLARRILGPEMSVLPTSDPETAIRAVRDGVRAIITDFNMGAFSGAEIVQLAMENGIPNSHILVATGEPDAARAVIPQEIKIFGLPDETERLKAALTEINLMLRGAIGEA